MNIDSSQTFYNHSLASLRATRSARQPQSPSHLLIEMASVTSQLEEWLIWSLSPKISAILLTLLISVLSPVIFHYVLYRKGASSSPPSFLLLGPSSSGKTALYTLVCSFRDALCILITADLSSSLVVRRPKHIRLKSRKHQHALCRPM